MGTRRFLYLGPLCALGLLLALTCTQAAAQPAAVQAPAAPPVAQPERFASRGVFYFPGSVRCPLAGVGTRGEYHSNRLAIDDQFSQVTVDRPAHRIVFSNTHSYDKKQLVGDLIFLGVGTTEAGLRVPVGIHLKLEKKGNEFIAGAHAHPTVRESMVRAEFEPFEVVLKNGSSETVALTPAEALTTIREPSIGLRLASKLLEAWDNLEGVKQDPTQPGFILVDVSFGFGLGGLGQKIIRGQIVSVAGGSGNVELMRKGSLPEMLRGGVWELRLRALSNLPGDAFERDLFLIGLDGVPLLKPLAKDGMEKDNMLTIRLRSGRGTVFFGNQGSPIPNAADVARDYLEFNALGAVLFHQVEVRVKSN